MAEPTTVPEVLVAAAAHMERYGWIQDDYATEGPGYPSACRVCPRGAIAVVVAGHPLFAVEWPVHCKSAYVDGADNAAVEADHAALDLIEATEKELTAYLFDQGAVLPPEDFDAGELIEAWADEEDRTLPQILGALRAAAERGRADA